MGVVVVMQGQAELLEIIPALKSPRRLADFLNGGQEQADQDGDDRNNDHQLQQGECRSGASKNPVGVPRIRSISMEAHDGPPGRTVKTLPQLLNGEALRVQRRVARRPLGVGMPGLTGNGTCGAIYPTHMPTQSRRHGA